MTIALSLPQAKEDYDKETFQRLLDYIKTLEEAAYLRNAHVEIYQPKDAGDRQPDLVLRSPDGSRWAIRISDAGTITGTAL